jgi:hypothetical protein
MTAKAAWRTGPSAATGVAQGAIAGLASGIALCVLSMLGAALRGGSAWTGAKQAAAPFFGPGRVLEPGFDAGITAVGLLMHFVISALWGALFGAIVQGVSRPLTAILGAVWGIVVWLLMHHMVLPLFGLAEIARATPVALAVVLHVAYGVVLGLVFMRYQPRQRIHAAGRATA